MAGAGKVIPAMRKPIAVCTDCGGVSYNATVVNGPCGGQLRSGDTCKGGMESALNESDWLECPRCSAAGDVDSRKCVECEGVGWHFVRNRDWLRVEITKRLKNKK